MAVLDDLPGLDVSIFLEDNPLKEYNDDEAVTSAMPGAIGEHQVSKTVSRYVEAVSDKDFEIHIKLHEGHQMSCPTYATIITIDGQTVHRPMITKSNYCNRFDGDRVTSPITIVSKGLKLATGIAGKSLVKQFRFSQINTTTDEDKLQDLKRDAKLLLRAGEILVYVYRATEAKPKPTSEHGVKAAEGPSITKVHEKALKGQAKSHTTSFGPPGKLVSDRISVCEKIDGIGFPIAIFRFKYRSNEALKSLLIIERTPTPEPEESPSPEPVDLNSLDAFQRLEVEELLRSLNGASNASGRRSATIKREQDDNGSSGSSRKKRKIIQGETIDLTDD